ncbi:unnamed protein product [Caenorhabditis angaria]|uniref:Uncharacterized protein n=1 Tax=Caenorhabditis angaria TaxID=860376 RepID=A0A9P1ILU8_9PELO|nr:unnamed protein product [Caenorhabditis angaria]
MIEKRSKILQDLQSELYLKQIQNRNFKKNELLARENEMFIVFNIIRKIENILPMNNEKPEDFIEKFLETRLEIFEVGNSHSDSKIDRLTSKRKLYDVSLDNTRKNYFEYFFLENEILETEIWMEEEIKYEKNLDKSLELVQENRRSLQKRFESLKLPDFADKSTHNIYYLMKCLNLRFSTNMPHRNLIYDSVKNIVLQF